MSKTLDFITCPTEFISSQMYLVHRMYRSLRRYIGDVIKKSSHEPTTRKRPFSTTGGMANGRDRDARQSLPDRLHKRCLNGCFPFMLTSLGMPPAAPPPSLPNGSAGSTRPRGGLASFPLPLRIFVPPFPLVPTPPSALSGTGAREWERIIMAQAHLSHLVCGPLTPF